MSVFFPREAAQRSAEQPALAPFLSLLRDAGPARSVVRTRFLLFVLGLSGVRVSKGKIHSVTILFKDVCIFLFACFGSPFFIKMVFFCWGIS